MDIKEKVTSLAADCIESESIFLVDVKVSPADKGLIRILLDGDNGVTIEDCSKLSRKLGNILEEEELIEGSYTLEVSSAGIGQPLQMHRQFTKNIDRVLKITSVDGDVFKGLLKAVNEDTLSLELPKKKKSEENTLKVIPFNEINKAIVEISF